MYRLLVQGEIAKVSREQNQAMWSKRTQDTSDTAALEHIYGEESVYISTDRGKSQVPRRLSFAYFKATAPAPDQFSKSAPRGGHRTNTPLSFYQDL